MTALSEFEAWIETAVYKLSSDTQTLAREELEAHFWDSVDAYLEQGIDSETACRTALADLGNGAVVQTQFQETHLSEGRYKTAVLLGALLPMGLLIPAFLNRFEQIDLLLLLFLTLPALYGFATLRILLEQRYMFFEAKRPLACLQFSGGLVIVSMMLAYMLLGSPILSVLTDFYLLKRPSPITVILSILVIVGVVGVGGCMIWLGEQLMEIPSQPDGSIRLFRLLSIGVGLSILICLGIAWSATLEIFGVVTLTAVILAVVEYALLIWLLFRGIINNSPHPMQLT